MPFSLIPRFPLNLSAFSVLQADSQTPSASADLEDLYLLLPYLATQAGSEVQVPVDHGHMWTEPLVHARGRARSPGHEE